MKIIVGIVTSLLLALTAACGEVDEPVSTASQDQVRPTQDSEYLESEWFAVTRVAEDDMLNMRVGPSAKTNIIFAIPYDAENLRGLDIADDWIKVYYMGHVGWVYSRYLKAQRPVTPKVVFGSELRCIGTEPHWRFESNQQDVLLVGADSEKALIVASQIHTSVNRTDTWLASFGVKDQLDQIYHTVIQARACDDGMSDRSYPYHISIIDVYQAELFSGCCALHN